MKLGSTAVSAPIVLFTTYIARSFLGSVALLSHFDKVFALLKCENEVNPVARIPWATSTAQIEIAQYWWPGESVLLGLLQFRTKCKI